MPFQLFIRQIRVKARNQPFHSHRSQHSVPLSDRSGYLVLDPHQSMVIKFFTSCPYFTSLAAWFSQAALLVSPPNVTQKNFYSQVYMNH